MRRVVISLCLGGAFFLSACEDQTEKAVNEAVEEFDLIQSAELTGAMLNSTDPKESVAYFARASAANPERIDLQRGLAISHVRAGNSREAAATWKAVTEHPEAEPSDSVSYADALIRNNDWNGAEAVLDRVPPTHETYDRFRLEAMVADSNKEWANADSFYESAVSLTTRPAAALNNWGLSKMQRQRFSEAERLFGESLRYDPNLFTAKNHLAMARAYQRNYSLPNVSMTQVERAMLLFNMGKIAAASGDILTAKSLLESAIKTHPQHFDEAVRALEILDRG